MLRFLEEDPSSTALVRDRIAAYSGADMFNKFIYPTKVASLIYV